MLVVENFFDNPEEVIEHSKTIQYYPFLQGMRSVDVDHNFAVQCVDKVLSLFFPNKNIQIFDAAVVFHKGDPNYNSGTPHKDEGVTGIVYLNDGGVDGTSIFKQINSNAVNTREERLDAIEKSDYSRYNKLAEEYLKNFKKTIQVSGEYNRATIFDGNQFHAADGFGVDKRGENRLTLLVFIRKFQIVE